jgi:histone deacetylase HOS2
MSIVEVHDTWGRGGNATIASDVKISSSTIGAQPIASPQKLLVSYHHNPEVQQFYFGYDHPMEQWRLTLTNKLIHGYGLYNYMDCYFTKPASSTDIKDFHESDYIDFLQRITPENVRFVDKKRYKIDNDCPIFTGLWNYCTLLSGASLDAANKLIHNKSDIAINWSGGLHHAKRGNASGFCFVNDIVLAILQLLRRYPRVIYIDIDVHHGDGVEAAFLSTDRVMTVSFHHYDLENQFFPMTGNITDCGNGRGKYYTVNVPLKDGIDDKSYISLFESVMNNVMDSYRPSVVVMQCGADSLGGDRLGTFNLNIKAHGKCVEFMKKFGLPLLLLGGGGYTVKNVSRLWCYETSIATNTSLNPDLPVGVTGAFREYFSPSYNLHPELSSKSRRNRNTKTDLEKLRISVCENMRELGGPPGIQMQDVPPEFPGLASGFQNLGSKD